MTGQIKLRVLHLLPNHGIPSYEHYTLAAVIELAVSGSKKQAPHHYVLTHEALIPDSDIMIDQQNETSPLRFNPYFRYNDRPVRLYRPVSALKDSFLVAAEVKDKSAGRFPVGEDKLARWRFYEAAREAVGGYEGDPVIIISKHHLYAGTTIPLDETLRMEIHDALGTPLRLHRRLLDDGDRLMRITRAFCRAP